MAFIPLAFVGLFIILAVWAVRSPKSRTDKEVGLTPQFEEICGGRIGMMNYTWPLVRHSIYDDFIVIKYLGQELRIWTSSKNVVLEVLERNA